jgi:hypothetical protein
VRTLVREERCHGYVYVQTVAESNVVVFSTIVFENIGKTPVGPVATSLAAVRVAVAVVVAVLVTVVVYISA